MGCHGTQRAVGAPRPFSSGWHPSSHPLPTLFPFPRRDNLAAAKREREAEEARVAAIAAEEEAEAARLAKKKQDKEAAWHREMMKAQPTP